MAKKDEGNLVKSSLKITLVVATLLILFLVMGYLMGQVTGASIFGFNDPYELTESDVFANSDFQGYKVSVFDVKLGDSYQDVIKKIGRPDVQQLHPPNIVNWEYSTKIDTDGTGLIVHMESGVVTSFTVKKPFNKYLSGDSKIQGEKEDLYRIFGKPDRLNINYPFTYYYFDNKGFDVITDAGDINGFNFRL